MKLLECIRKEKESLQEGIAFIAFYKTGRQWHTQEFWDLDDPDYYDESQTPEIEKIIEIDSNAMIFNGYHNCPDTEYLNQQELYQVIKMFYEDNRVPAQVWLNNVQV